MAVSDLSKINLDDFGDEVNPDSLFQEWLKQAKDNGANTALIVLATSDKQGHVTSRTLVIRDIIDGNLILLTSEHGQKYKDIIDNPRAAVTVLHCYKDGKGNLQRQIRIEGSVEILSRDKCELYFERDRFHGKIRTMLCKQGADTAWADLKARHDQLVRDVADKKVPLSAPDHTVVFQLIPNRYDFYEGYDTTIADRILFTKDDGLWKFKRVQA